jgi:lipopolysaccharide export system permease protein
MKILTRYIIREFIKPLFFSIAAFSGLVMISEFFRELSFYLEKKTPFTVVISYLLLNVPWWCIQVLPVSVLLAVLFSLGQFARQGEVTAMKAAGVNPWRLVVIFLLCGLAIAAADLALREKVIPYTVKRAEIILQDKIKNEKAGVQTEFYNIVVSLPPAGRATIGHLNANQNSMQKIVIDYFTPGFVLKNQVVAESAAWEDNTWNFFNGVERSFSSGSWQDVYFSTKTFGLPFQPKDFVFRRLRPEQMTTPEYHAYIGQLATLGLPTEKDRIQFYLRFASALSYPVVMMIGIPFALGFGGRHGKMISFTFALIFAFVYWGAQAIGQSMGGNRLISPLLAAWLGNIVFGVFGIVFISKMKK